jgi:hypothetical protein
MEARGRLPQDRGGPFAVMAVFLIACVPLYYLTASGLAFFCAASALYELLPGKRRLLAILWLCAGALIPAAMSLVYFEPDIFTRYFRWIATPENGREVPRSDHSMHLFLQRPSLHSFSTPPLASRLVAAQAVAALRGGSDLGWIAGDVAGQAAGLRGS